LANWFFHSFIIKIYYKGESKRPQPIKLFTR
jgi:hypothetical protein